jgi:hypothetical protein
MICPSSTAKNGLHVAIAEAGAERDAIAADPRAPPYRRHGISLGSGPMSRASILMGLSRVLLQPPAITGLALFASHQLGEWYVKAV